MSVQTKKIGVPFVDLKAQHLSIKDEIDEAMASVFSRTAFILGPETKKFEEDFANYCNAKYAVGVDSGTTALELILRAYGIGPGDEVITVANTFIATALAISNVGAEPVLVDIHPQTYNIDVERIEEAITERTKVIMPVHLYGQPADMDAIQDIAKKHNLIIVEDACQAHGAKYKGKRIGSMGNPAAFSFYPSKNLGACGDAGMVVTDDEDIANYIKMFRNVGQSEKYYHAIKGHNHRIDNLQSAILGVKLAHLDQWNSDRRRNANKLNQLLKNYNIVVPFVPEYCEPVWHLYVIRVKNRDGLMGFLKNKNIGVGIHYPIPIHLQEAYSELGYNGGDFPITEEYSEEIVTLPMFPEMSEEQIVYLADAIKEFVE